MEKTAISLKCPVCGVEGSIAEIDLVSGDAYLLAIWSDGEVEYGGETRMHWNGQKAMHSPPRFVCMVCSNELVLVDGKLVAAPELETPALIPDGNSGVDYALADEHDCAWVKVGNLAIYIKRTDEGVAVDIFPAELGDDRGDDMHECLAGTYAFFAEAEKEAEL